jgi:hypothetical protein
MVGPYFKTVGKLFRRVNPSARKCSVNITINNGMAATLQVSVDRRQQPEEYFKVHFYRPKARLASSVPLG